MTEKSASTPRAAVEQVGRGAVNAIEEFGYYAALLIEGVYWLVLGRVRKQPVRLPSVFMQMMASGVTAIPIVFVLSFTIGVMLAIQGIHTLKTFGAESQVVVGIAFSVTREFAPLIVGILVAGRTGSALAARLGTMQVTQEIDALRVMGINPVRYLVSPTLLGMLIMVPTLTIMADLAGLLGGAIFSALELGITVPAYADRTLEVLTVNDITQGLIKSCVFAVVIVLVGVSNGFSVSGGAEGVGRATTRSVVLSIAYIIVADMLFTYYLNR